MNPAPNPQISQVSRWRARSRRWHDEYSCQLYSEGFEGDNAQTVRATAKERAWIGRDSWLARSVGRSKAARYKWGEYAVDQGGRSVRGGSRIRRSLGGVRAIVDVRTSIPISRRPTRLTAASVPSPCGGSSAANPSEPSRDRSLAICDVVIRSTTSKPSDEANDLEQRQDRDQAAGQEAQQDQADQRGAHGGSIRRQPSTLKRNLHGLAACDRYRTESLSVLPRGRPIPLRSLAFTSGPHVPRAERILGGRRREWIPETPPGCSCRRPWS